jgi:hypothetical protein
MKWRHKVLVVIRKDPPLLPTRTGASEMPVFWTFTQVNGRILQCRGCSQVDGYLGEILVAKTIHPTPSTDGVIKDLKQKISNITDVTFLDE